MLAYQGLPCFLGGGRLGRPPCVTRADGLHGSRPAPLAAALPAVLPGFASTPARPCPNPWPAPCRAYATSSLGCRSRHTGVPRRHLGAPPGSRPLPGCRRGATVLVRRPPVRGARRGAAALPCVVHRRHPARGSAAPDAACGTGHCLLRTTGGPGRIFPCQARRRGPSSGARGRTPGGRAVLWHSPCTSREAQGSLGGHADARHLQGGRRRARA
jgi:hypothetical protein